jgi:hypothetical protein
LHHSGEAYISEVYIRPRIALDAVLTPLLAASRSSSLAPFVPSFRRTLRLGLYERSLDRSVRVLQAVIEGGILRAGEPVVGVCL